MKKLLIALGLLVATQAHAAGIGHAYFFSNSMKCASIGAGCTPDQYGNFNLADHMPQATSQWAVGKFAYPANHTLANSDFNATVHWYGADAGGPQKVCFVVAAGFNLDSDSVAITMQDLAGFDSFHNGISGPIAFTYTPTQPVSLKHSASTLFTFPGYDVTNAANCTGSSCLGMPGWMGVSRLSKNSGLCFGGTDAGTTVMMVDIWWQTQ